MQVAFAATTHCWCGVPLCTSWQAPTPEEKAQLVKYVGWGAFAQDVFANHKPEWKAERDALRSLLDDSEYEAAKASTLNLKTNVPS